MDLIKFCFIVMTICCRDSEEYHLGPKYTIACLENGDVTVKGLSNNSQVTVTSIKCDDPIIIAGGIATIPAKCITGTDFEQIRNVTLIIKDDTFDAGARNIQTPVPDLNGGKNNHSFTIECQPLKVAGVEAYVVHGVGLLNGETVKVPTEVAKVEMRVKAEVLNSFVDVNELPDISSVYVGDKFYLYLVYTGKDGYRITPQNCKVYDGAYAAEPPASKSVPNIQLWTRQTCLSSDAANYRIMNSFQNMSSPDLRIVYAEMFGFHFAEHSDITFVCDVRICIPSDVSTNCYFNKDVTCKNTWPTRRRRSVQDKYDFQVAQQIKVSTKPVAANSSGKPFTCVGVLKYSWLALSMLQILIK